MNKLNLIIAGYIIMALMTNSYTRNYRWDDWSDYRAEQIAEEYREIEYNRDVTATGLCVTFCTIFWPLYWTSRVTDVVVDVIMRTKIEIS